MLFTLLFPSIMLAYSFLSLYFKLRIFLFITFLIFHVFVVLFCFVLFCFVFLFCLFVLFCFVLLFLVHWIYHFLLDCTEYSPIYNFVSVCFTLNIIHIPTSYLFKVSESACELQNFLSSA